VILVLALAVGALVGAGLWVASRPVFAAPGLQRTNYRGVGVPVAAGLVIALAAITIDAGATLVAAAGVDLDPRLVAGRVPALLAALGFGLLGLLDDLAAHGDDRGFRGHVRQMVRGRLTTGGVKLAGGGLLAVSVVGRAGADDVPELVLGAVVVALAANLGNLFDRAPGRTTKVALVAVAIVALAATTDERWLLIGVVVVVGAGVGLLPFDLREDLMLGDAGANVLGAAAGLAVVLTTGLAVQAAVAVGLLGLNLLSEVVSFSSVIDRVAPLRAVDRLGRRRAV
jgi:UDP-N-acetylmuramyl pentapeptide phosphotransferase/UDP-N-acetylglucosamine-1-phosphate transferase